MAMSTEKKKKRRKSSEIHFYLGTLMRTATKETAYQPRGSGRGASLCMNFLQENACSQASILVKYRTQKNTDLSSLTTSVFFYECYDARIWGS